jgi:hypothetical protein
MQDHQLNYYDYIDNFIVDVSDIRTVSEKLAVILKEKINKMLVILNSGVDSEIIIKSLQTSNASFDSLFFYIPGYNDHDLNFIKFLEFNYGINPFINEIHFTSIDQIESSIIKKIENYIERDYFVINGIVGPTFVLEYNKFNTIDSFNSIDQKINSKHYLDWGRVDAIKRSILNDKVLKDFSTSFEYFQNNNFLNYNVSKVDYWQTYIKTHLYSKYWGKDLFYYPGIMLPISMFKH